MKLNKIISVFLLILVFFLSEGYFIFFKLEQYEVKKEIKKQIKSNIPKSKLTLIKIAKNKEEQEIKWCEDAKEFRYKDQMYDIVITEKHQNFTYYYCIKDDKETELFAKLDILVNRKINNDKQSNNLKTIFNILTCPFLIDTFVYSFLNISKINIYSNYFIFIKNRTICPDFPPPKEV